ncbi:SGNH/GDSL hydrolase family protein [Niallia oryzisoli]|uniref:SGNH/GDSL hydrolase family protein n=1 Tax=Niallia oryzisoli TaxID=1737571 RepID=UPI0037364415
MQRQQAIIIIASLLLVSVLLIILSSDFNQVRSVSLSTEISMKNEKSTGEAGDKEQTQTNKAAEVEVKKDHISTDSASEEEEQLVADSNNERQTLTKGIKKKIREVVEGTIRLFKKDLRVVAIGDSLTQGVGDETESGGFVGILEHTFEDNHLNISVENYGKRGNRTDQLLERLENKEIESSIEKADTVMITIGANDIMKIVKSNLTNLTLEPFQEEREAYMDRLRNIFIKVNEINPDVQIYLVGFYNPFEEYFGDIDEFGVITDNWNDAGKSVTEEFENTAFIPVADIFDQTSTELLADDFFHPNTHGYKLIAQRVLENLNEVSIESETTEEGTE